MTTTRLRSGVWFAAGAVIALIMSMLTLTAWRADAAPGDSDSTFVPTSPCRLTDSRTPPNRVGPLSTWGPSQIKTVQATGTNGQCIIPADAVGLSMNVTALNATQLSYLTFWPSGTQPLAASLNPSPGAPPTPNAVTTSLSSTGSFNIYNESGSVDIVIDVNGYYTKQSLQDIQTRVTALERGVDGATVTSQAIHSTTSASFLNVPGASVTETTAANGRLLVTFSAEVDCEDNGPAPTTAWCMVEVLVDGVAAEPGATIYASGQAPGPSLWTSRSHEFVTDPLTAGPHTVQVRYRVDETAVVFSLDNWTLSALPLRS